MLIKNVNSNLGVDAHSKKGSLKIFKKERNIYRGKKVNE